MRHIEQSSYAGLTRVSIKLHKNLTKRMDGRVKPGHDELMRSKPPTPPLARALQTFSTAPPLSAHPLKPPRLRTSL